MNSLDKDKQAPEGTSENSDAPAQGVRWFWARSRTLRHLQQVGRSYIGVSMPIGPEYDAIASLIETAPEMYEAMAWFCERVESGEVHSAATYQRFKVLLARARGETPSTGSEPTEAQDRAMPAGEGSPITQRKP